jgi:hypothetical protein
MKDLVTERCDSMPGLFESFQSNTSNGRPAYGKEKESGQLLLIMM